MNVPELKQAYDDLGSEDQLLFAALVAADQMIRTEEFRMKLERRHAAMEEGKKWGHEDVMRLHEELSKRGL